MMDAIKRYGWGAIVAMVVAVIALVYFAWSWLASYWEEEGLSLTLGTIAQGIVGSISSSGSDESSSSDTIGTVITAQTGYAGRAYVSDTQARVLAYRAYLVGLGWVPCCRDEAGLKAQIDSILANPATALGQYTRTKGSSFYNV